jgi:hypothetical protein
MLWSRSLFCVVLLLLTMVSAQAFQETVPGQELAGPGSTPPGDESVLGLGPEDAPDATAKGAEGLGVGGLPNLDFGLELLYGGTSQAPAGSPPADDDVGLRLKHTF